MTDQPHGLRRVEEAMAGIVAEGSLGESLAHHLGAGGKRLRAALALRAGDDLGVAQPEAVAWASACELLHNATLVHDDLCDRDPERRGRTSVWAGWGDTVALCLGDLLLAEAFAAVEHIGPDGPRRRLRVRLHDAVRQLTRGQAMEADAARHGIPDRAACRRVAEAKTVPLVVLPVAGPLELAGIDDEGRDRALHAFGLLGLAYQTLDDLEDLLGPGRDLRRQVPNHALGAFAETAGPERAAAVHRAWRDGTVVRDAEAWLARIRASSAPDRTLDGADERLATAAALIADAPAAVGPAFRMLAGHLERQAEGLRGRVAEARAAGAAVAA